MVGGGSDTTGTASVRVCRRWHGMASGSLGAEGTRGRFRRAELGAHCRRTGGAMTNRTLALFTVAALVCSPAALRAQDARLDARLDAHTRDAVITLIDSARAEGIPSEP